MSAPSPASARLETARVKDALARLASGVALVTCWEDDAPRGLAATSFVGLSVDPARVLFCVREDASSHAAFVMAKTCAAVILAEADHSECEPFGLSTAIARRFVSERWRLDDPIAPKLRGGLAQFDLATHQIIKSASSTIFIANVLAVETAEPEAPLIFFDRAFATLAPLRAPED